jgi:hypothetical protein
LLPPVISALRPSSLISIALFPSVASMYQERSS